ncbi:MAG TPA: MFS transporter [Dehalococcoidia bacterium]|nr:MFS transporter [Dehalococcoidia bacterium]
MTIPRATQVPMAAISVTGTPSISDTGDHVLDTSRPLDVARGTTSAGLLARHMPALDALLNVPGFLQLCVSNGLAQAFGTRLQTLMVAWLVLEMTDSKIWLGLINGAPAISIVLFSLVGGVMADSRAPRRLLMLTRVMLAVTSLTAAVLIACGLIRLEYLVVYMLFVFGLAAVDMPVARTLTHQVAGSAGLLSATSTQSVFTGLFNMTGPLIIGVLITHTGASSSFGVLVAGYVLAVLLLRKTHSPVTASQPERGSRPLADLSAAIRYIRSTPTVATLAGLGFLLPVAGVYFAMVPVYARDILRVDATGLGLLAASFAAGSLLSSSYLAASGKMRHRGIAIALLGVAFGAGMIAFALSKSFLVSSGVSLGMGVIAGLWQNTLSTLVQLAAAPEMRGRVVAVFTMGFQMVGVGWLICGVLGTLVGVEATLVLSGCVFSAVSVGAAVLVASVRRID